MDKVFGGWQTRVFSFECHPKIDISPFFEKGYFPVDDHFYSDEIPLGKAIEIDFASREIKIEFSMKNPASHSRLKMDNHIRIILFHPRKNLYKLCRIGCFIYPISSFEITYTLSNAMMNRDDPIDHIAMFRPAVNRFRKMIKAYNIHKADYLCPDYGLRWGCLWRQESIGMLYHASGINLYEKTRFQPQEIKLAALNAGWDIDVPIYETRFLLSARVFLEFCAESGLGIKIKNEKD